MLFSGNNFRLTPEANSLKFAFENIIIDHQTGVSEVGFSGQNKGFRFGFRNNLIYSPKGRVVYSYNVNEPISISGTIETGSYQYFINEQLIEASGEKENFTVQRLVVNTTGCSISSSVSLYSNTIDTAFTVDAAFKSLSGISGKFVNNSNYKVRIFDSSIFYYNSQEDLLSGVVTGNVNAGSSLGFFLHDLDTSRFDGTFTFLFSLKTNFGDINKMFTVDRVSGLSDVVRTITANTSGLSFDVEFFGSGLANKFIYTPPINQSKYLTYSAFADNLSGQARSQTIDVSFEPIHPLQSGYYRADYLTGITITSTGQYATCPQAKFTGYYSVTGFNWNPSSMLLSSGCTGNVPVLFTRNGFLGTGASGYVSVKKIRLSGIYGVGINTFYIYNGLTLYSGGTGYTQSPEASLNTGIYVNCYDVPKNLGNHAAYTMFNPTVILEATAAYMSGETICDTGLVSGGAATGYTVTGINITNVGSGYNSTDYIPRFSFVRVGGDTLTSNASGIPLMKQTGRYIFNQHWTLNTGISTQALSPLTGTGVPYTGSIGLSANQNFITFQVGYSGLDNTEPVVARITLTNENSVSVTSLITGWKTYDTSIDYLKKKSLDSHIFFALGTDLSFLLTQDELDEYYSSSEYQNGGQLSLGDLDF